MSGRRLRPGTRGASLRVSFADAQEQRLGATPARPLSKLLGGGGLATWPLLTTLTVELGQAETAGRGRNRFREAGLCADNTHYQRLDDLSNRTALITGSGRGIGKAIPCATRLYAKSGEIDIVVANAGLEIIDRGDL